MVAQIWHINRAAWILSSHEGTMKQRLAAACEDFWAAMENPDEWPTDLMEQASRVVDKILESSTVGGPVKNMDERTARRVARAIARMARELQKRGVVPADALNR